MKQWSGFQKSAAHWSHLFFMPDFRHSVNSECSLALWNSVLFEINSISNHVFFCWTQWKESFTLFCSNRFLVAARWNTKCEKQRMWCPFFRTRIIIVRSSAYVIHIILEAVSSYSLKYTKNGEQEVTHLFAAFQLLLFIYQKHLRAFY